MTGSSFPRHHLKQNHRQFTLSIMPSEGFIIQCFVTLFINGLDGKSHCLILIIKENMKIHSRPLRYLSDIDSLTMIVVPVRLFNISKITDGFLLH